MEAGIALLGELGVVPCAIGAAMLQSRRWVAALPSPVEGVLDSPLLIRARGGWEIASDQREMTPFDDG